MNYPRKGTLATFNKCKQNTKTKVGKHKHALGAVHVFVVEGRASGGAAPRSCWRCQQRPVGAAKAAGGRPSPGASTHTCTHANPGAAGTHAGKTPGGRLAGAAPVAAALALGTGSPRRWWWCVCRLRHRGVLGNTPRPPPPNQHQVRANLPYRRQISVDLSFQLRRRATTACLRHLLLQVCAVFLMHRVQSALWHFCVLPCCWRARPPHAHTHRPPLPLPVSSCWHATLCAYVWWGMMHLPFVVYCDAHTPSHL